ncbi:phospholipase/carboxylesterase [Sphaerotilus hippei]|uniref:Phospholipase/carboxylesterase n=1 Tax=Sphaerotilus hippei TaxID=744406 RepID=A0A318H363_9BURK|nr:esterase [Sphaerotilus hippei]PXW97414.1 phospholipase/carboxylesterase [Sphaerotilus hippei]
MNDLILQKPALGPGQSAELFLLFHGVGARAADLGGVGASLAGRHAQAWVVSVQAPRPSDLAQGWQWFSVRGVTPENRAGRVAEAMPGFVQSVLAWQKETGLDATRTTLIGFSQGAIMSLESTQLARPIAGRVAALAGRFALAPRQAPGTTPIHLLHGEADSIVPTSSSIDAHAQLLALGANVSLDLIPGLGHGIDARMMERLHHRLAPDRNGA